MSTQSRRPELDAPPRCRYRAPPARTIAAIVFVTIALPPLDALFKPFVTEAIFALPRATLSRAVGIAVRPEKPAGWWRVTAPARPASAPAIA